MIHRDKVVLCPDPKFLSKVSFAFHLSQPTVLPSFFPNPRDDGQRALHTLDVCTAIIFYLDWMRLFHKVPHLFVAYSEPKQGLHISTQRLSKWISSTISLYYESAGEPLPVLPRAHSTRAVSMSSVFPGGGSLWMTFAVQLHGPHLPPSCPIMRWMSGPVKMHPLDRRCCGPFSNHDIQVCCF